MVQRIVAAAIGIVGLYLTIWHNNPLPSITSRSSAAISAASTTSTRSSASCCWPWRSGCGRRPEKRGPPRHSRRGDAALRWNRARPRGGRDPLRALLRGSHPRRDHDRSGVRGDGARVSWLRGDPRAPSRRPLSAGARLLGLLVFAYGATRGEYPIETIGLTSKAAEVGLALVTLALTRRRT